MFETWKARRLINEMRSGSIRENADTVDKLRAIGPAAIKPLVKGLSDKAYRVKLECIRALGYIGDPQAIPAIEPLLKHKNEVVQDYARHALDRLYAIRDGRPVPAAKPQPMVGRAYDEPTAP